MPASIFNGQKVKTLKDTLTLNGKSDIISSTVDPTASAVDAPIGSLLINQTSGKLYRKLDAGSSVNWEEVGAGVGGINYILNPSAEVNTTGWATYADAAGTAPVDGTGGSPSVTWTRSTTTPLRGVADFNFAKDAANRQGQGVSYDFTIALADKAKVLSVTFDYEVLSGTYADGDLTVYLIADPTGTPVVIQPAGYTVLSATSGTTMRQRATFQTQATGTSYRLCFHVASTSASAYTLAIDNVVVGPQQTVQGAAVSDWQSYTPTLAGVGTATSVNFKYRRVGDTIQVTGAFQTGTPTAVQFTVSLPYGTIDSTKINTNATIGNLTRSTTLNQAASVLARTDLSSSVVYVGGEYQNSPQLGLTPQNGSTLFAASEGVALEFFYPAAGLSSNTVLSQDTDTRVVAMYASTASGTITGTPSDVTWTSITKDTHGSFNGVTYTVPVSGYYQISGQVRIAATYVVGNAVGIALNVNSSNVMYGLARAGGAQVDVSPTLTTIRYLNAGDLVKIQVDSAGTSPSFSGGGTYNYLSINRLSGPATIAASESVIARYKCTTADTTSSTDPINYDTKDIDTHNAVTTGAAWKFTAPISGRYLVNVSQGAATATSNTIYIYINGSGSRILAQGSANIAYSGSDVVSLNAGDYIDIRNGSGTVLTLTNDSTINHIAIERLDR